MIIPISKANGYINNLVGLCLAHGYDHNLITKLKKQINTHIIVNNKCSECDFDLRELRADITNEYRKHDEEYILGLSCKERIIKKLLE